MRTIFPCVKGCHVGEIAEQDCATLGGKLGEASSSNRKESKSCLQIKRATYWAVSGLPLSWARGGVAASWEKGFLHPGQG